MGRLDGKIAIVTGGGSGFGAATCVLFAQEGARVVVADWNAEDGQRVTEQIKEERGEATYVNVDVSKSADVQEMVNTAITSYGKLDILFNNAGMQWGPDGPLSYDLATYPEEEAEQVIDINFKGNFLGMKYAIPEMLKNGGGSILATASSCVFSACQGHAVYAGTKGAIYSLARSVAVEYATKGIRCNTIGPGPGRTPFHKEYIRLHPDGWDAIVGAIPMQRAAEPQDVAYAALFFASDESKYITGQNLMVDGGYTCGGFPIPMTDD